MMFVMFTKRTEDPKLKWIEHQLTEAGIPHKRDGWSFHGPILSVPEDRLADADAILAPVDDIPDDDPMWVEDPHGCACGPKDWGQCAFCQVFATVATVASLKKVK